MKEKNYLILDKEFISYCELNKIKDIQTLAKKIFQRGFTIEKYGDKPTNINSKEIIKEVIVEVIKEVPVEKIVEVIKEVPVDKIITNDDEINRLINENEKMKKELNDITNNLEKVNRIKYLKGSNLNNLYSE